MAPRAKKQAAKRPSAGTATDQRPKITLYIYFDGLCVFVPGPECDVMRVLLVNGCGGHASGAHTGSTGSPHVPYIQAKKDDVVDPGSWDLFQPIGPPEIGAATATRFLRWLDISVLPEPSSQDLTIAGGRYPGSSEPDSLPGHYSENDFSWVAELDKAAPGSGDVDSRCFDADPPRELVIARTRLLTGSIQVQELAKVDPDHVIWLFKGSQSGASSGYSQALATQIRYKRIIYGETARLQLRPFQHGQASNYLELKPKNPKKPLIVKIGNLPLADILSFALDDYPGVGGDEHFKLLYRLSQQPPADPPVPTPVSHPPQHLAVNLDRAGTLICYAGTAKPHGRA
jgi:hypothetical protein